DFGGRREIGDEAADAHGEPRALQDAAQHRHVLQVIQVRVWFSGTSRNRRVSGQMRDTADIAACTQSGRNSGLRLLNPPGKRFVSTGASLKPLLRRSTDA